MVRRTPIKCQDGNGSTYDDGPEDHTRKPQEKSTMLVQPKTDDDDDEGDPSNPESRIRGRDELMDFTNTEDFPVDMNADDAERLFKLYMAKQQKGYRT